MVCVPCIIIPLLLYIWHKFVQPILLRYWNPWEKKDDDGNVIKKGPDFPFECKGGVCPFVPGGKKTENVSDDNAEESENPPLNATAMAAETEVDESKKEI
nr:CG18508 [Drosophila melanogaster]AAY27491.1 CG18508 [Drosophila melanogaster]AAY27495.1 CG18508 [Drosophila melanogaster]AAY27499.1 CG18508 [Drosophila melanogaster]AAY27503.1 CG18508 [Drosophila melanogaster]